MVKIIVPGKTRPLSIVADLGTEVSPTHVFQLTKFNVLGKVVVKRIET